jgi:hypothetical protein
LKGERREIPNGAEFRRARNPERREIPKSGTAKGDDGADEATVVCALLARGSSAVRDFAPFGIPRPSEFGAVRDLAPLELQRRRG